VRSGRINKREASKLHQREREIARHEARAKANGVVTPQEREQLRNELAALNAEVDRMMRNGNLDRHDGR
jgi:multidrug resistance efflux pump